MDKKAMLKQAAQVLREQQQEIHTLHEERERNKIAEQIVQKLIENDELLAENVFQKLSELRMKPVEELQLMEKAAEMFRSTVYAPLGSLTDIPEQHPNPLIEYLLRDV